MNNGGIATLTGGLITAVAGIGIMAGSFGASATAQTPESNAAGNDAQVLGVTIEPSDLDAANLGLVHSDDCGSAYGINGTDGLCSHGADPAPAGFDVDGDALTALTNDASARTAAAAAPACDKRGGEANRVQAVYVRSNDVASRFVEARSAIVGWAAEVDEIFNNSAAKTGGSRKVRWAVTANCTLDVAEVVIPANADDSFSASIDAMKAAGFNRADRKYVMFVDANVVCGVGSVYIDDAAAASNKNNGRIAQYARIDAGCWSGSVAAHELMHTLGGVQPSAPHGTDALHCTDETDLMCYADTQGVTTTQVCNGSELFDCNNDDYFSTAPAAGTYLATKWNTANSAFLFDSANPTAADVGVTTTQPANAEARSQFVQTVTVANLGNTAAKNVSLNHAIDDKLMFISLAGSANCTTPAARQSGAVNCQIANLAAGARITLTIKVEIKALADNGYSATSVATATHGGYDSDTGNGKVASITDVTGVADSGQSEINSGNSDSGNQGSATPAPVEDLPVTPNAVADIADVADLGELVGAAL